MLKTALHNGINFTGSANRASGLINFGLNSSKNIIPRDVNIKYLLFYTNYLISQISLATLTAKSENADVEFTGATLTDLATGTLIMFQIPANQLYVSKSTFFELKVNIEYDVEGETITATETIFSDVFEVQSIAKMKDAGWVHVTAKNNDNRHGFLANEAFGFFQKTGFNEDVFINKKTEYEYSYGRKKILSSENNIAKRLTFKNLSTYQQILLKWLCNSEILYIDGVQYELISDFTELLADENSEVKDLRADFVEVEHSSFATGSSLVPSDEFSKEFFVWKSSKLNNFNNGFDYILPFNLY